MSRLTYEISDDNKRRLDILRAFATLNGGDPTLQDILNEAILRYFVEAYRNYCERCSGSDMMRMTMEKMIPQSLEYTTLQRT